MGKEQTVIVGAGIAGAATAYFLTRRAFSRKVLLLEKEKVAGAQSTGRNAAILRTMIPDPLLNGLARQSATFYREPPEGFADEPLVNPVGVYLAARPEHAHTLRSWCDSNREAQPEEGDATRLYDRVPLLAPGLAAVAYNRDDGVLDVHAILQGYIRGACRAGAELRVDCQVTSLDTRNGRVGGVQTSKGFVEAAQVIIATGGWAAQLAEAEGYPIPLVPYRRHLLATEPLPEVDPRWPVVWIVGDEFYFRPESGGLLMSGCDTVRVKPEQGETVDSSELERIADKAAFWLPSLAEARVARAWAGMRTSPPDDRFVIGADPRLPGLYWVAGLGGHGITCAPVVGALAAAWIVEGGSSHPAAAALAPHRIL